MLHPRAHFPFTNVVQTLNDEGRVISFLRPTEGRCRRASSRFSNYVVSNRISLVSLVFVYEISRKIYITCPTEANIIHKYILKYN